MNSLYLEQLNDAQRAAVQRPQEPVLVLAGPGTGKTRVLVARVIHLLQSGLYRADQILALTFTNKAAGEMKQRIASVAGGESSKLFVGTFHSFALEVARKHHKKLGLAKHFSVCDAVYQKSLVMALMPPGREEEKAKKAAGVLTAFSNHILKNKPLRDYSEKLFRQYRSHLKKYNLVDFDQILELNRDLFRDNPDILDQYRHMYPAVLVDEFQDTDVLQYEIIRMLAEKQRNLFIVADDDQSIYAWRGANPENIRKFIDEFSVGNIIRLEDNYRSGAKIVEAAQKIIEETDRVIAEKQLQPRAKIEDTFSLMQFPSEGPEEEFIVTKMKDWAEAGIEYREMAVIYPFHRFGEGLEPALIQKHIPYQMANGRSFIDNKYAAKMINYLRIIQNPEDEISLQALIEAELGKSVLLPLTRYAAEKNCSLRKALNEFYREENNQLRRSDRRKITDFVGHLANLVNLKSFYKFSDLANEIFTPQFGNPASRLRKARESLDDISGQVVQEIHVDMAALRHKNWLVYHPDPHIAWLGARLLFEMTGKHALDLSDAGKLDATTGQAVWLLHAVSHEDAGLYIPVFRLRTEKCRGAVSALFKLLQVLLHEKDHTFDCYVVFDLETTGKDTRNCDVVEIAAVRVEQGRATDRYVRLVKPQVPIEPAAEQVHHISMSDVENAPGFGELWPEFKAFIGDDMLVAHNGYKFDFPIIDRFARKYDGNRLNNLRSDSLMLAQKIFPNQTNSIDSLIERFGLDGGNRHRAEDDVLVLIEIFERLQNLRDRENTITAFEQALGPVALANLIENTLDGADDREFFLAGGLELFKAGNETNELLAHKFGYDPAAALEKIEKKLNEISPHIRQYSRADQTFIRLIGLTAHYNDLPPDEAISKFLSYVAMHSAQDALESANTVSLLTYHAAKGLEFDKVIIMGLEQGNMPGFHATQNDENDDRPVAKKLEEQRRLMYVGITRGKSEVILTEARHRNGYEKQRSAFLADLIESESERARKGTE